MPAWLRLQRCDLLPAPHDACFARPARASHFAIPYGPSLPCQGMTSSRTLASPTLSRACATSSSSAACWRLQAPAVLVLVRAAARERRRLCVREQARYRRRAPAGQPRGPRPGLSNTHTAARAKVAPPPATRRRAPPPRPPFHTTGAVPTVRPSQASRITHTCVARNNTPAVLLTCCRVQAHTAGPELGRPAPPCRRAGKHPACQGPPAPLQARLHAAPAVVATSPAYLAAQERAPARANTQFLGHIAAPDNQGHPACSLARCTTAALSRTVSVCVSKACMRGSFLLVHCSLTAASGGRRAHRPPRSSQRPPA